MLQIRKSRKTHILILQTVTNGCVFVTDNCLGFGLSGIASQHLTPPTPSLSHASLEDGSLPNRRRRKVHRKTQAPNLVPAIGCSQYRHQARGSDQRIQSERGGRAAAAATEMSAVAAEQALM